ncbi:MAG: hypothetical protein BWY47_01922 [Bacteroidetes bacterium ADurb.Bin302]|jgi:hypothetical protein|nr:MAG: hypothetical protein BWY47_01922 [Bacteroidetes bacterium ADurb.Bin302]
MSKITPSILRAMRDDITKALEPVVKKYGLSSLTAGNASYSPDGSTFTYKINGVSDAQVEEVKNDEKNKKYAKMLGLPEDAVGRTFTSGGETFKITRIDINKPKYPIIATKLGNSKSYKLPISMVRL